MANFQVKLFEVPWSDVWTDRPPTGEEVAQIFWKWADWLIHRLIGWLVGWLVGWLIDWLIDWLASWLIDWLADWLIYLFIYLFIYLLTDWLIDWLIDYRHFNHRINLKSQIMKFLLIISFKNFEQTSPNHCQSDRILLGLEPIDSGIAFENCF